VWRVRFDLATDLSVCFGLDINDDIFLGRGQEGKDFVDLGDLQGEELGVSRRHVMLRPTATKLFVLDLGSTNGSLRNGRSIGVNTPYSISDGDILTLGNLEFIVRIIKRPSGHTAILRGKADVGDALAQLAKAITGELDRDDVLSQALEMAMGLTSAGEAAIWIVDEQTGEMFLEAERGIEDDEIKLMRLPVSDSMAGKVLQTKEPLRTSGAANEDPVKIKTDYLVEAVVYVPLILGGVAFGVLAAAHREPGKEFSERDEKLLVAIADFAAIAIQNARLYEATDNALTNRIEELAELNHALAHDLRGLMASISGYAELLKMGGNLGERDSRFVANIVTTAKKMMHMIDQMLDIAMLNESPQMSSAPFDLSETVATAIGDLEGAALARSVTLDMEINGRPYLLDGDSIRLYRSVLNLIDNAIKYSPEDTEVTVTVNYGKENVTVSVRDRGPGIPKDDLPRLFEKYFRGKQMTGAEVGTGLGLHMVQATVAAHAGTVTARNLDGDGAEFTITLPASLRVKK